MRGSGGKAWKKAELEKAMGSAIVGREVDTGYYYEIVKYR